MRIRLIHFLCYEDNTFHFGNEGIVLISGKSGAGKTSLLKGIFFALFGEGNKLQTHGKTSCRVELDFDDIKIIRSKRPNRLIVNDVHEDAVGQEIINEMFGKTFKTSGYIQQNNLSSFILMSSIEKLTFLEKFAFDTINLTQIKQRCKSYISKKHDDHLTSISELNMAQNILKNMIKPEKVVFPLKCKKSQIERVIKNENIRYKNCNILIKRFNKNDKILSQELTDIKILFAKIEEKNKQIKNIEIEIQSNIEEQKLYNYKGDEFVKKMEKRLKNLLEKKSLILLKNNHKNDSKKLNEMYKDEKLSLENNVKEIEKILWKLYTKEEINETLEDLSNCIDDVKKIKKLSEELLKYSDNIIEDFNTNKHKLGKYIIELNNKKNIIQKLKLQKNSYKCPNCESILYLNNEKLYLLKEKDLINKPKNNINDIEEEILKLENIINSLKTLRNKQENDIKYKDKIIQEIEDVTNSYEDKLPELNEIKKDLKSLHKYEAEHIELEKKQKYINNCILNDILSSSYNSFKNNCLELEQKIKKYEENLDEDYKEDLSEEKIRNMIIEQKNIKNKTQFLMQKNQNLNTEKEKITESILYLNKNHEEIYKKNNNYQKIEECIKENNNKILDKINMKNIHEENMKKIVIWKNYQKDLDNYNKLSNKIKILENKEKDERLKYSAILKLKNKILESESIAMMNIIESINTHARIYLDSFFQDDPILVQLQTFKETKKINKPCINIMIEYKGMECDLTTLSGGELTRVVLSYTLALAEIFNTPLILLDECTSNLDEELTSVVFDSIKEHFNGKMILIIAHQVISGTFDNIINLK